MGRHTNMSRYAVQNDNLIAHLRLVMYTSCPDVRISPLQLKFCHERRQRYTAWSQLSERSVRMHVSIVSRCPGFRKRRHEQVSKHVLPCNGRISSLNFLPLSNPSPPAQPVGHDACNKCYIQTPQVTCLPIETQMFRGQLV